MRKDGTIFPGIMHNSIIQDDNGNPIGITGTLRDITERKQAEEKLRESEERLWRLFETMAEGVVLIAPDGQIVQANPAAELILGLKRSEIEARNYVASDWELFRPDGTSMQSEEMAGPRAMKEKRTIKDIVMGVRRSGGSISWINVSAVPIINQAGELDGVVGTFEDITERKKAEEALLESEDQFRRLFEFAPDAYYLSDLKGTFIDGNTAAEEMIGYKKEKLIGKSFLKMKLLAAVILSIARDIINRKQAEEQIKASLKEKEVLLQEIHHRVRNNMQVVSSLLKLQAGKMKDEKIRQAFKENQRRVSAMALVHETLYKSESLAEIGLQKHIPALVDSIYRTFRVKGKVDLQVDVEDIKLSIDQATPLSLVINELISNSLQHAFPEGKGEIVVKVRLRGDDEIEVVISDNGPGIPEDIDYDKTLGLQLVEGLAESQLGGTWDIKTKAGTKHTIRFKKKEWTGFSRRLYDRSTQH